eukprot:206624-Alexandrium_andersonii.AAC.1
MSAQCAPDTQCASGTHCDTAGHLLMLLCGVVLFAIFMFEPRSTSIGCTRRWAMWSTCFRAQQLARGAPSRWT